MKMKNELVPELYLNEKQGRIVFETFHSTLKNSDVLLGIFCDCGIHDLLLNNHNFG